MSDFTQATLGDCCEIVSGATPKTGVDAYWDGDVRWATPKDLSSLSGMYIDDTPRRITEAGLRSCAASILPAGSVLFSSRAPIGHVAINVHPLSTNQGFKSLIPKAARVEARYLAYWLKANRSYLEGLGNGATFKEISKATMSKIEIPLPSLEEQRRIAQVLDSVFTLRTKRREAISLLDDLTQSIFFNMFGDPTASRPMSSLRPLANIVSRPLQNGAYYPKELYTLTEGGVEMVHMSDAFYGQVSRGALKRVNCSDSDRKKYALDASDLLISRRSLNYEGSAKPCLIPSSREPLIFESSLIRVTPNEEIVSAAYLNQYLSNPRVRQHFVFPFVTGSTIFGISQKNLGEILIMTPPIDEQIRFAHHLAALNSVRAKHQAHLAELDALFASVQHRAFRGELWDDLAT